MKYHILLAFLLCSSSLRAQTPATAPPLFGDLSGIARVEINTQYQLKQDKAGEIHTTTTHYDTSRIRLREETHVRSLVDTGYLLTRHLLREYNPTTKLGTFITETFANPLRRQDQDSKTTLRYRSHDHKDNNEWEETRDKDGKLLHERNYAFNHKGERISSKLRETRPDGDITHEDVFERNEKGAITRWTATDTENGKTTTTRLMSWTYLSDTLLLRHEGYIYNNWIEIDNKYDKNLQITQSTTQTGYRQDNGKILIDTKTTTQYKNGKAQKTTLQLNGKTAETTLYSQPQPNTYVATITRKEGKKTTVETKTTTEVFDAENRLTAQTTTINGKEKTRHLFVYEGDRLTRYEFSEWEGSADALKELKKIYHYDERGNVLKVEIFNANQLTGQSAYAYFP